MTEEIDFSAGSLDGKCNSVCNCQCMKHKACISKKCDDQNGICLIEKMGEDEKKSFFIPSGFQKVSKNMLKCKI